MAACLVTEANGPQTPPEVAPKRENIGSIRIFDFDQIGRVVKNLAVVGAVIACSNKHAEPVAGTLLLTPRKPKTLIAVSGPF